MRIEGHVMTGGRVRMDGRVRTGGCVGTGGRVKHRDALSKTQGVEIAQGKMSFFTA